jgi:quercetin dioxygenase-like cupin family protein
MPEPRWFIHNLMLVHLGGETTDGRVAIVEGLGRRGDMPPLHIHHREDETFYVLDGTMTVYVGGDAVQLQAGQSAHAPKGIPHCYRIESETARWLVVCSPGEFDRMVLDASDPAPAAVLPPEDAEVDLERVGAAAAAAGIELLGPPGTLPAALTA